MSANAPGPEVVAPVTAAEVEAALRAALQPTQLEVVDESHLHAGHAGAREGRHFRVRIRCASFDGQARLGRHRLVYSALEPLIRRGIHALAIEARGSGEG